MPRYRELSVDKVWPLLKDVKTLNNYFPDYNPNQLPDRKFMFTILSTFRFDVLNNMIKNANKNRSLDSKNKEAELVHISNKIYKEIDEVMTHKRKKLIDNNKL